MLSKHVLPLEKVRRPLAEHTKWSSETCCPGNRIFDFRTFSLLGTGFLTEDFVGYWWALPNSQAVHFGWSHFQAKEKIKFLPKRPEQSIHWAVVKLKWSKRKYQVRGSFYNVVKFWFDSAVTHKLTWCPWTTTVADLVAMQNGRLLFGSGSIVRFGVHGEWKITAWIKFHSQMWLIYKAKSWSGSHSNKITTYQKT